MLCHRRYKDYPPSPTVTTQDKTFAAKRCSVTPEARASLSYRDGMAQLNLYPISIQWRLLFLIYSSQLYHFIVVHGRKYAYTGWFADLYINM